jgi:hypothetical protein
VKTVFELIGQPCPRCKVGVIVEIDRYYGMTCPGP